MKAYQTITVLVEFDDETWIDPAMWRWKSICEQAFTVTPGETAPIMTTISHTSLDSLPGSFRELFNARIPIYDDDQY